MLDIFSFKDMLKFFIEGEGEDESSPREQRIEEVKNFRYLKFDNGLSGNIVYVMCSNQSMHQP
jgi:hypothetical protein